MSWNMNSLERFRPLRNFFAFAFTIIAVLLGTSSAEAQCHCFCSASTQLGFKERAGSVPDEIIGFGSLDDENGNQLEWNGLNCLRRRSWDACRQACDRALDADQARWGSDTWLCETLGRPFDGEVAAYHKIGNQRWRELGRRQVRCKRCCACEQGWYDGERDSCVGCIDPEGECEVPGMPDGDKGGGYWVFNGQILQDLPGESDCRVVPGSGSCKPPCEDCGNDGLVVDSSVEVAEDCDRFGGMSAIVTLVVNGGASPYTIDYDGPPRGDLPRTTPGPSVEIAGFSPGSYRFTITDAQGVEVMTQVQVESVLGVTASATSASCLTCSDGTAIAVVTNPGAVSPITYRWNDPAGQTTAIAADLLPGTYRVLVTDGRGCFEEVDIAVGPINTP